MSDMLSAGFLPASFKLVQLLVIVSTAIYLGKEIKIPPLPLGTTAVLAYGAGLVAAVLFDIGPALLPYLFGLCAVISLTGVLGLKTTRLDMPVAAFGSAVAGAASVPVAGTFPDMAPLLLVNFAGAALLLAAGTGLISWSYHAYERARVNIVVRVLQAWIFAITIMMLAFTVA